MIFRCSVRFIIGLVLIVAALTPAASGQTQANDQPATPALALTGALLSVDLDLQASFASYRPLWSAALDAAAAANHAGVAVNVRVSDLLTVELADAWGRDNADAARAIIHRRLSGFEDFKQAAHEKNLLAVLSLDGRLARGSLRGRGGDSFAFASDAAAVVARGPVTGIRWHDGATSPVLAINDITGPEGLFVFTHDFALKCHRLFSPEYLNDGNTTALASRWVSAPDDRAPIVDFPLNQPFNIERIKIYFQPCYPCPSFEVLIRETHHRELPGEWGKVYGIDNNENSIVDIRLPKTFYSAAVQLKLYPPAGQVVRLQEVEIWIRNARGQEINVAPEMAFPQVSSSALPPWQKMIAVVNNNVYALADPEWIQKSGVMLIPGQWGLLALGEVNSDIRAMVQPNTQAHWFAELKEQPAAEAMRWRDVPLPLYRAPVREGVARLTAGLAEALRPDAVLLAHVDWGDLAFDWSDAARGAFESWLGRGVENYPADILRHNEAGSGRWSEEAGPLFGEWVAWRADTVARTIRECRARMAETEARMGFGVLLSAPLDKMNRNGLNWMPENRPLGQAPSWHSGKFAAAGVGNVIHFAAIRQVDLDDLYARPDCGDSSSGQAASQLTLEGVRQVLPDRSMLTIMPYSY